jgi:pyruvate, water dikinase
MTKKRSLKEYTTPKKKKANRNKEGIYSYIVDLSEVELSDLELVGGKNASLGEMIQNLKGLGVNIPGGFALTVNAYWEFIRFNKLDSTIRSLINGMKKDDLVSLRKTGLEIREIIRNGQWPEDLKLEIQKRYTQLSQEYGSDITDVAVRSSATAEDLPDASFAGQQETYLNVRGPEQILTSVRNCFASLYTDRAISYRDNFGFDHFDVGLSVCVQKMVRSDLASSGVAFSLDTESGFKDVVLINGSYGLGESVVQVTVSPDELKTKTKVGICGQGPSDYPDFAQFLVEEGIDTISVTPDSMLKTIKAIHKTETKK